MPALLAACGGASGDAGAFRHHVVDADGPHNPWGKAAGDINGDGSPDWVVGGNAPRVPSLLRRALFRIGLVEHAWLEQSELVWYESPGLEKHLISDRFRIRTDIEVVDLDGDGRNDVVAVTDDGLVWFRNPDWTPTVINARMLHDVEVADFDGDGKLDIVARNQQLFDANDGELLDFFRQVTPTEWIHSQVAIPKGEGLKVADMDGDGRPDVVVNQVWLRNTGDSTSPVRWDSVTYCPGWDWPHAYIEVHDMNQDVRPDIVMAPAEPVGQYFRLSWCETPADWQSPGMERVVDERVETVMHSVVAGDFDLDGRADLVTAQMYQGIGHEDVALYSRTAEGGGWSRSVIGRTGSHSMKAADIDQDGDLDLLGANWAGDHQPVDMWINNARQRTAPGWKRHVIDGARPWRSVFIDSADMDRDGRRDIVTGGWWYRNPGLASGPWERRSIGPGANNMALIADIDGDGDVDVISSTWNDPQWTLIERLKVRLGMKEWFEPGGMVWAENDGAGTFRVGNRLPPGGGDFLQGAALTGRPGEQRVVVSWHQPGQGLRQWQVPPDPAASDWRASLLSAESQDEALSVADLDGDGLEDLVLGTRWLKAHPAGEWTAHTLHVTTEAPDRNRVADIDGDGKPDVVIGYEAISETGKLAWYRQGIDPTLPWTEHVIAQVTGPMSLDVKDMDGDGDFDVVVGEHNLNHPDTARLIWFENRDGKGGVWAQRLIHIGDEHHNGAHVVDIDQDGDMDVISIGWGHDRVVLYENLTRIQPSQTGAPRK